MAEARRRRRWTVEQKRQIVEETSGASASLAPRAAVGARPGARRVVARRYDINANLLFKWKREAEAGQLGGALATTAVADLVPIGVVGRGPDGAPTLLAGIPGDENGLRPSEPCRSAELAAGAALTGGVIEIDLPCGTRVRVDAAVDARALGRVLGALKRHP